MRLGLIVCLLVCTAVLDSKKSKKYNLGRILLRRCIYKNLVYTVKNRHVDVMELMDHSASLTSTHYDHGVSALKYINEIINTLSPPGIQGGHPATASRVGYVKFSHPAFTEGVVSLAEVNDLAAINNKIDIPFDAGNWTAMTTALELADVEFAVFSQLPTHRHKRVWLVTDGENNIGGDPESAADTLKSWRTHICVVGVGNSNDEVLKRIASPSKVPKWKKCFCKARTYAEFEEAARWALMKARKMVGKS